jgi:hypothetical protein
VVHAGEGLRLLLELSARCFIRQAPVGKNLDRDVAIEPLVMGLIHHAHATGSQFFQETKAS